MTKAGRGLPIGLAEATDTRSGRPQTRKSSWLYRHHAAGASRAKREEQRALASLARRNYAERLLGRSVAPDILEWTTDYPKQRVLLSDDQVRQAIAMLVDLNLSLQQSGILTPDDRADIRKDLSDRVLSLWRAE